MMKIFLLFALSSAVLGTFPGWAPGSNKKAPLIDNEIFSRKHLTVGSTDPPPVPGKPRLYGMRFSPYAHRVVLVLLAKGIPFDPVYINLKAKPEWYPVKVPGGIVPALQVDGSIITESLIIADYLDDKYPLRPLNSRNPLQKAKDRLVVENFNKMISAYGTILGGSETTPAQFEALLTALDSLEKELGSRKTTFLGGYAPGIPDYMIWPWIERIGLIKTLYGDQYVLPEQRFPNVVKWSSALKKDPAVKAWYVSPEDHAKFIAGYKAGHPDFDFLTKTPK